MVAASWLALIEGYAASNRRFHRTSIDPSTAIARTSTSRIPQANTRETCKLIRQKSPSHRADATMPAFDVLRAFLEARAAFTPADLTFIQERFIATTLPAGEFLQRGGDVARHAAFVASGCLRSYVIGADGKEHIVQFAPETWWLADGPSLMTGAPSQYFIDAIEDSELLLIDPRSHQEIVEAIPGFAAAQRAGLQRHNAAKDQRIVTSLS